MNTYKFTVKLLSDTLIGSGQGFGVLIDSDVVFDDSGIPYIPARRIKGLLRESAEELNNTALYKNSLDINSIFGISGGDQTISFFSDLKIEGSDKLTPWLNYIYKSHLNSFINAESVREYYTKTRTQTAIEDRKDDAEFGTAKKNSLRTVRVLNKGLKFTGKIQTDYDKEFLINTAKNLKWLGTKRNRGFGNVKCEITEEGNKNA